MSGIEQAAEEMRKTGACEKWFDGADAITRKVCFSFVLVLVALL